MHRWFLNRPDHMISYFYLRCRDIIYLILSYLSCRDICNYRRLNQEHRRFIDSTKEIWQHLWRLHYSAIYPFARDDMYFCGKIRLRYQNVTRALYHIKKFQRRLRFVVKHSLEVYLTKYLIDETGQDYSRILQYVAEKGNLPLMIAMYSRYPHDEGNAALICGIQSGRLDVVEFLLRQRKTLDTLLIEELYSHVVRTEHVRIANALEKYWPFPIMCRGRVSIEMSIEVNCSAMTQYLLERRRFPSDYRFRPVQIQILIDRGWDTILTLILQENLLPAGPDTLGDHRERREEWIPLYRGLLVSGDLKNLNLLLPYFPEDILSIDGKTLSVITQHNQWPILKWLDQHSIPYSWESVFEEACVHEKKHVLWYLLNFQRKHLSREYQSNRLCDAIRSGRHSLVLHLVNNGIDLFAQNDKAFALAHRLGNSLVVQEMTRKRNRELERMFATLVCSSV